MAFQSHVFRLKGWQVFVILQLATVAVVVFYLWLFVRTDFEPARAVPPFWPVALFEAAYFGWMLVIGTAMNARLPSDFRRGRLFPTVGLTVAVCYTLVIPALISWAKVTEVNVVVAVAVGLVHLFSMIILLYLVWYASRALVAAERNERPPFVRVLVLFLILWHTMLLPVAAWWVQSRARRVGAKQ